MDTESELLVADPKVELQQQSESNSTAKDVEEPPKSNPQAPVQEAVRTEPVKMLEPRKRRLDRQLEEKIPEIHIVGEINCASGVCLDVTEGVFLR